MDVKLPLNPNDWKHWSLWADGLRWRVALPEDLEAILALNDQAEKRLGRQDVPNFFLPPVILTLVAETPEGEIVDAVYMELEVAVTKVGLHRTGMSSAEKLVPVLGAFAASRHLRIARIAVPRKLRRLMQPALERMGFASADSLSHWIRKLLP